MPLPPQLDICDVLCLTKKGEPPISCRVAPRDESQEERFRGHIHHVTSTCDATRVIDINTITNFLFAEPEEEFILRLKQMLKKSKGKNSWRCCSEVSPSCDLNASNASTVIGKRKRPTSLVPRQTKPARGGRARASERTKGQSEEAPCDSDLSMLQYVQKHRMVDSAHRHIQLCCHLKDGTDVWLRESTVQKASNAAVCTYWGCGPGEEWKRPGTESVLDSISPEPLKIMTYRKNAAEVRLQMVGSPASQEQWMSVEDVKAQWPTFYEENCAHAPSSPSAQTTMHIQGPGSEERDLQTIVGHRLQEDDEGGGSQFQLSCQWDSGPETWEDEVKIQSVWNAAVLTYWNSEPGLRTLQAEGKVPHRYLRIQSHDEPNRTMEVQWLGYSACADETSWESFSEVKEKWSSAFESYVKLHSLESLLDS